MARTKGTTKYDPSYLKKIDNYLKTRRDRRRKLIKQERDGDKPYAIYDYGVKVKLPTIEGFADYLGVARKTLYNWEKENIEFRHGLERIRNEQLQRLINEGLAGNYNPTIAKLMLSSNHGMRERLDATSDDEPLSNFSDEQIDRIADRIVKRRTEDGDQSSKE